MPFALSNRRVRIPSTGQLFGTGWLPPVIDPRDYTPDHAKLKPLIAEFEDRLKAHGSTALQVQPTSLDLRPWCSHTDTANRWHGVWHGGSACAANTQGLSRPFGQFWGRMTPSGAEFLKFHRDVTDKYDSWRPRNGMRIVERWKPPDVNQLLRAQCDR